MSGHGAQAPEPAAPAAPADLAARCVPGAGAISIEAVGSGLVNRSFRVGRDGSWFSLRLTEPAAARLGLDRQWECRVLQRAAAAGLAPPIVRCEPAAGILVTRWVHGTAWSAAEAVMPRNLKLLAQLARRVHALPLPEAARSVTPAGWIDFYRQALHQESRPRDTAVTRQRLALEAPAQRLLDTLERGEAPPRTLCHSDLHAQNVLIDAGGGAVILDWEYAHVSEPSWDLAGWASNSDLDAAGRELLLRHYLERAPTPAELSRLHGLAWIYDYVCLLWSELYLAARSGAAPDGTAAAVRRRARRLTGRLRSEAGGCGARLPAH